MGISLSTLVLNLAYALDDVKPYVVSHSTSTSVNATGLGNATANASINTYDGAWAYVNNQQRRVQTGGYLPSFSDLTITPQWAINPVINDVLYITRLFPIGPSATPGEDTPYQVFIQQALKLLAYADIITLPMTSVDTYSLATWGYWLDRQERLIGIREPAPSVNRRPVDASWRGPLIEQEGTNTYLRLGAPFETGAAGNLTLDVMRPAFTLVNGAESTTGPTLDSQTTEANPDDVQIVALREVYYALMVRQASSPDGADWARRYAAQDALARSLTAYDGTRDRPAAPTPQPAGAAA